jgi:hypothetical protein
MAPCSDHGVCSDGLQGTGLCNCSVGWEGAMCMQCVSVAGAGGTVGHDLCGVCGALLLMSFCISSGHVTLMIKSFARLVYTPLHCTRPSVVLINETLCGHPALTLFGRFFNPTHASTAPTQIIVRLTFYVTSTKHYFLLLHVLLYYVLRHYYLHCGDYYRFRW